MNSIKLLFKRRLPEQYRFLRCVRYQLRRFNPFISSGYVHVGGKRFRRLAISAQTQLLQPNLFVIGAEKAGTTSLHHYLDQHPDIFMSKPEKEPQYLLPWPLAKQYFERSGIPVRNADDILKNHMLQGYQGQKIFGESTTSYTRGNNATVHTIPHKIQQLGNQVRCVYIVRHPIDRLVSAYQQQLRLGWADKPLKELTEIQPELVQTSLYSRQLEAYRQQLPDNHLKIIIYEEFTANPQKTLAVLYGFLDVDLDFTANTSQKHNQMPDKQKKERLPKALQRQLAKEFSNDTKQLAKILKRDLPWTF